MSDLNVEVLRGYLDAIQSVLVVLVATDSNAVGALEQGKGTS